MLLRRWTFDDVFELNNLENEIFKDPWSVYAIYDAINCDVFHGVALVEDNNIIGYYGFYSIPPEAHIANVAIKKEYRGKKLGDLLMQDFVKTAESLGDYDFTLEVRASNEIAKKLYEKYGFKAEGLRKKYYGDGEDAVIMWRRKDNLKASFGDIL